MFIPETDRPRIARRVDGSLVTVADLPTTHKVRWVRSRKAAVVEALYHGLISRDEVQQRYQVTATELNAWCEDLSPAVVDQCRAPWARSRDADRRSATRDSAAAYGARLTDTEHALYCLLRDQPGDVVSRAAIFGALYPDGPRPKAKILDVMICRVRRKLDLGGGAPELPRIETVWGRGYRYVTSQAGARAA